MTVLLSTTHLLQYGIELLHKAGTVVESTHEDLSLKYNKEISNHSWRRMLLRLLQYAGNCYHSRGILDVKDSMAAQELVRLCVMIRVMYCDIFLVPSVDERVDMDERHFDQPVRNKSCNRRVSRQFPVIEICSRINNEKACRRW